MDDQTAALQKVIDSFPDCFFAEDMVSITKTFASSFSASAKGDEVQLANINNLLMTGQQLQQDGGDGPDPAHSGISGLLCTGSEGRTRFLSAYASCFRRDYDLAVQRGSIWNLDLWVSAAKSTFNDFKQIPGDVAKQGASAVKDALLELFKGLWPILVLIVVVIVAIVAIAFATKGQIGVSV